MIEWLRQRMLPTRVLVYAAAAILAFAVAAGVGAATTLVIRGDLRLSAGNGPGPAGEQEDDTTQHRGGGADHAQHVKAADQQDKAGAQRMDSATQQDEDEYGRHVKEASARLKQSNEMVGREFRTLEGAKEVSPS
jgi:hypothetical protein